MKCAFVLKLDTECTDKGSPASFIGSFDKKRTLLLRHVKGHAEARQNNFRR